MTTPYHNDLLADLALTPAGQAALLADLLALAPKTGLDAMPTSVTEDDCESLGEQAVEEMRDLASDYGDAFHWLVADWSEADWEREIAARLGED